MRGKVGLTLRQEDLDIRTRRDLEDGRARNREAHLGNAEAKGLAAVRRGKLQPVVLFKRPRRVETQPVASLAILRHALHRADGRAEVSERIGVDGRLPRTLRAGATVQIEFRRPPRKDRLKVGLRDEPAGGSPRAVEYLTVVFRDARDVEFALHTPLDLERDDARIDEFAHVLAKAQVFHREREGLPSVSGGIGGAAAVGALAAIAAAVLLHRREETQPRNRIAERTVDERLEFESAAPFGDGRDFLKAEFTRQDDAGEAEFLQGENALEVVSDELRRGVEREVREVGAADSRHAEILHDQCVRPDLVQFRKATNHLLDFAFRNDRIEGDVDLLPVCTGVGDEVLEVVGGEVRGEGPRREVEKSAIDGISTRLESRERRLEVPRRGQKFDSLHTVPIIP